MTRNPLVLAWMLMVWAGSMATTHADESVVVLPAEFALSTPESRQRLILQEVERGEVGRQVVDPIEWSSSDPGIATVNGGVVNPVADGRATIIAKAGGRTAMARVSVTGMTQGFEWSFRNHVEPVLAKQGCNSGACHGALAGKGGFRLSLQGYDPDADFFSIVKQDRGRRVEFGDPGRSLFLAKPSGAIAHKGGVRFSTDSLDYKILAGWIAAGSPRPSEGEATVDRLEVSPVRSFQRVGQAQQILVRAIYTDGRAEDVTRSVKWNSADESVCRVDEQGKTQVVGPGEGSVVAWFASKLAIARVTVPYGGGTLETVGRRKPRNFIDDQVDRQLTRLNLPASPECTDPEFVRRAYVDTIGRLPTVDETRGFLADPLEAKRDALIDRLIGLPEFVDYWTYKWSDLLMINGTKLRPQALKAYYQWVRKQVADGVPWDRFVREIVTASGESIENGATNFYALSQSPEDMTENVSQAFLGLSIGCAKCHNHPLEKWTNDQYYGMASLFARVRAKGWGGEGPIGRRDQDALRRHLGRAGPAPDRQAPGTGAARRPTARLRRPDRSPGQPGIVADSTRPTRISPVDRQPVWANFFGVGLVEKVDDMRASNPASNEALLAASAAFVVENKFDLKALMKAILRSNAYQRSSQSLPGNRLDRRFYSRYYPRRMMAEVCTTRSSR